MTRSQILRLCALLACFAFLLGGGLPTGLASAQEGGLVAPAEQPPAGVSGDPTGGAASQSQISPAFTYQGSLTRNGRPVNAACAFRFSLWDEPTGGSSKGDANTLNAVTVQAGVFNVLLNFLNQFPGDERYLQTEVKCPEDADFVTLAPRQLINAAPYAIGLRPGAVIRSAAQADALYVEQTALNSVAVHGKATQTGGTGVLGESTAWAGVWGQSTGASGVVGISRGEFNGAVYGENRGRGYGLHGKATQGAGVLGESRAWFGVYGKSTDQTGVVGESSKHDGVRGVTTATNQVGVRGVANSVGSVGVWGESAANTGVYGLSISGAGVWGVSSAWYGVVGESSQRDGVRGVTTAANQVGVRGIANAEGAVGVWGESAANTGVYGLSSSRVGVWGVSTAVQSAGVLGNGYIGVVGETNGTQSSQGVRGDNGGSNTVGSAGYFNGRVRVIGNLSKGGGSFQIDHPLDPENKYLSHSFVESPDMKNIYDGVVVLDASGEATVQLPDWFEALNRDFRYQLTAIGGYAPVYISREVTDNQFRIAGGAPGLKVSWQVTGIRHDPYAEQNRIKVEENKAEYERGMYLYPDAYGLPMSRGIATLHAGGNASAAAPIGGGQP